MSGQHGVISKKARTGFQKRIKYTCRKKKKNTLYTLQSTPSKMNNFRTWPKLFKIWIALSPPPPPKEGGTSRKIGWGCAACFLKPKVCDFSQPYFRPDQKLDTLFQTCLIISSLGQTNVKAMSIIMLLLSRIQNCTKFRV